MVVRKAILSRQVMESSHGSIESHQFLPPLLETIDGHRVACLEGLNGDGDELLRH